MKKEPSISLENNNQVILSYELLALLSWMIQNEAPLLKQMITKALSGGLNTSLDHASGSAHFAPIKTAEDAHDGIVEFFGSLEAIMLEVISEQTLQTALEKNLMPAIDQIDAAVCDDATVRNSVAKATSSLKNRPTDNPQEVLFKELLRQWKPAPKKKVVH